MTNSVAGVMSPSSSASRIAGCRSSTCAAGERCEREQNGTSERTTIRCSIAEHTASLISDCSSAVSAHLDLPCLLSRQSCHLNHRNNC